MTTFGDFQMYVVFRCLNCKGEFSLSHEQLFKQFGSMFVVPNDILCCRWCDSKKLMIERTGESFK